MVMPLSSQERGVFALGAHPFAADEADEAAKDETGDQDANNQKYQQGKENIPAPQKSHGVSL